MRKCNKKRIANLLSVLCIIALCPILMGAALPEHTSDFYVNDYANILSEESEKKIVAIGDDLCDETTAQVVVLTIESLEGRDISEYSVEIFRDWSIGDKEKENGVLILFSLDDREIWITTGYGIEATLTDVRLGQLRDTYAMPYYKEDNFEKGTMELYCAIVNYIRTEEYDLEPLTGYENMDTEQLTGEGHISPIVLLFPAILIAIAFASYKAKYNRLLKYDAEHGTQLAQEYRQRTSDIGHILLYTLLFRGGRGGGRGGGFGGGGGGFRGGGGSTGGGGAGGKF